MKFKNVSINDLEINPFKKISQDWMLLTVGNNESFNTMTVSWGTFGRLWNKNVSFIFVRPQRYTFEFLQKYDYYSLAFLDDNYREALNICGKYSGRIFDKVKNAGLIPIFSENAPYFEQSKLIFICKKLYADYFNPNLFADLVIESNYPNKDYHKIFIGEVIKCLERSE